MGLLISTRIQERGFDGELQGDLEGDFPILGTHPYIIY